MNSEFGSAVCTFHDLSPDFECKFDVVVVEGRALYLDLRRSLVVIKITVSVTKVCRKLESTVFVIVNDLYQTS